MQKHKGMRERVVPHLLHPSSVLCRLQLLSQFSAQIPFTGLRVCHEILLYQPFSGQLPSHSRNGAKDSAVHLDLGRTPDSQTVR